jgi:osmoprotectant transport system ATP-binding protein
MGDRIAILRTQSKIAQYDTPEKILTDPADDFVADFIGAGASIKRLRLSTVDEIEPADWPVARLSDSREEVRNKIRSSGKDYALLLDDRERPNRWVTAEHLELGTPLEETGRPAVAIVEANSNLYNTLDTMITSYKGSAIVVDEGGRYKGVVDFETVLEAINAMRPQEQTRDKTERERQAGDGQR